MNQAITPERERKSSGSPGESRSRVYTARAKKLGAVLLAAASVGGFEVLKAGADAINFGQPIYTKSELDALPHKSISAEPGMGIDAVISKADQDLNQEEKYELRNYVEGQGQAANNMLMAGQSVEVPVLPGHAVEEPVQQALGQK